MLTDLDPKAAVPLYEQIRLRLKAAVATGELRAGDSLPSVRQLAGKLRINPATVVQAYRTLEEEGFLELRQGAGTFVRAVPTEARAKERSSQARRMVREFLANAARLGLSKEDLREAIEHELDGTGGHS
jgi:GntR family transcriptional regulator